MSKIEKFYDQLKEYAVDVDSLRTNSYPFPVPGMPGAASIYNLTHKYDVPVFLQNGGRLCSCRRCGKAFSLTKGGAQVESDECVYHFGRLDGWKAPKRYNCCGGRDGATGCSRATKHVYRYNGDISSGFVTTTSSAIAKKRVYALDCEMCYTINGMELCRVTILDHNTDIIYDSLVKPSSRIVDYHTRFSGISEDDMKGINVTLRDVQDVILNYVDENTILLGHGLENDLTALKLIHHVIVDTALVFPHRRGLPYKRSLKYLARDFLYRTIQNSGRDGHDSKEDAAACLDLMKWKIKNGGRDRLSFLFGQF